MTLLGPSSLTFFPAVHDLSAKVGAVRTFVFRPVLRRLFLEVGMSLEYSFAQIRLPWRARDRFVRAAGFQLRSTEAGSEAGSEAGRWSPLDPILLLIDSSSICPEPR